MERRVLATAADCVLAKSVAQQKRMIIGQGTARAKSEDDIPVSSFSHVWGMHQSTKQAVERQRAALGGQNGVSIEEHLSPVRCHRWDERIDAMHIEDEYRKRSVDHEFRLSMTCID